MTERKGYQSLLWNGKEEDRPPIQGESASEEEQKNQSFSVSLQEIHTHSEKSRPITAESASIMHWGRKRSHCEDYFGEEERKKKPKNLFKKSLFVTESKGNLLSLLNVVKGERNTFLKGRKSAERGAKTWLTQAHTKSKKRKGS